jgi:transposase
MQPAAADGTAARERAKREPYPSDLTDAEWCTIEPFIPPAKPGGRPRKADMREILNGIFYVLRSGCTWRMIPHDLPAWYWVYGYFRTWRLDGTWERIQQALCAQVRVQAGREASPSAAIIDSQSVKTTEKGGLADTTLARKSRAASGM